MSAPALLEVTNLIRSNLCAVSLSLSAQELVCLSGPSGAGKTLMLRALADLDVSSGQVSLQGVPREQMPATQWRRQVGYLPAESRWWAATVAEHYPAMPKALFRELGFDAGVRDWQVERLSSGERQRLALLRLLANEPKVLLLDEPTANLDAANIEKVERLVRDYLDRQEATCLWVTHAPDQIRRIATRTLYLDRQGLRRGAPA